ncbi:MAG: hypothetical protein LBJ39_00930 [Tannerellaceae bacterium]|jgi:hypothetical protein|nr:hypothetical protein [Tannerellaceae bacterium]
MEKKIKVGTKVTVEYLGTEVYTVKYISKDGLTADLGRKGMKYRVIVPVERLSIAKTIEYK